MSTILINFGGNHTDCIFPNSVRDIEERMANLFVLGSLSEDLLCESNQDLYNLSLVNKCALACLNNDFFKKLFSLQHPFLGKEFKFTLFSKCYPNVYWKVLCDIFSKINIVVHTVYNRLDSASETEDENENEEIFSTDFAMTMSSFKFKSSFLEMGAPTFQCNNLSTEEQKLERELEIHKQEKAGLVATQGERPLTRGEKKLLALLNRIVIRSESRLEQVRMMLSKDGMELCCQQFNLSLFNELGEEKLKEKAFSALPLLEQCSEIVAEINKNKTKITPKEKELILKLYDGCHWMIRWEIVEALLGSDPDIEAPDGPDTWFEENFPKYLLKLPQAIDKVTRFINAKTFLDRLNPLGLI